MSIPPNFLDKSSPESKFLTFTQFCVRHLTEPPSKNVQTTPDGGKVTSSPQQLVNLLTSIQTAIKCIGGCVRRAGSARMLGTAMGGGSMNVQGEEQQKLDVYANEVIINVLRTSYSTCFLVSEELENVVEVERERSGDYVVFFDPLDGSNNIDCLATIGTIFAIYKRTTRSDEEPSLEKDVLQSGRSLEAALYVLYGSATMIVVSLGDGVHGFTYDPRVAEFLLTHPNMRVPEGDRSRRQYSTNEGYRKTWDKGVCKYVDNKKAGENPYAQRYIGTFIADFHRTLIYGGMFLYPANADSPGGKLRLLYECNPASFLMEQAGGRGTDGSRDILDKKPSTIHDRTPVFIGSTEEIEELHKCLGNPLPKTAV